MCAGIDLRKTSKSTWLPGNTGPERAAVCSQARKIGFQLVCA